MSDEEQFKTKLQEILDGLSQRDYDIIQNSIDRVLQELHLPNHEFVQDNLNSLVLAGIIVAKREFFGEIFDRLETQIVYKGLN